MSELESDFGPKVRVWSPKFSNPGVGVGVPQESKDSTLLCMQQYHGTEVIIIIVTITTSTTIITE